MDKLDFKEIFNSLQTLNLSDLVEIEKNLLNGLNTETTLLTSIQINIHQKKCIKFLKSIII